ncbi:MAG: DUF3048 domain-containing protein [Nocardioidaceae bacterium]|nr:DUF3048 domain-containing protein [Nocardioidaceae bacterium]
MSFAPPTVRSRLARPAAAVALALVASLAVAGCGGSEKKESNDRPTSQPTQGGTKLAAVWPLTGLPAPETTPNHPVMIVKIDNTAASDPQVGLGKADMVVEELVEGGITRLAALFYSQLPAKAGPVRSARASDIGVVRPTHAVLVASGMAPDTVRRLNDAKVKYFTMGAPGVQRDAGDPQHDFLHSVFVNLPKLARSIKAEPVVPASYLPWGKDTDFAGVAPATKISVAFSRATTTRFTFDAATKKYTNVNSYAGRGDEFKPDSVLVLRVREGDAGYRDPAGNPVPETLFFGRGNLVLFHNGQLVRGTWTKAKRESPLQLSTAAGPLKVPAGHVWIELLPTEPAGGHLTFQ